MLHISIYYATYKESYCYYVALFYNQSMNLKTLIQEYKSKTGYSDSDIAKQCNVSRSTVMRWSKGEIQRVSTETMNKLSEMFGYNIEPILKGLDFSLHLPILGYVKAGYDLFAQENYIGEEEVSLEEKKW